MADEPAKAPRYAPPKDGPAPRFIWVEDTGTGHRYDVSPKALKPWHKIVDGYPPNYTASARNPKPKITR